MQIKKRWSLIPAFLLLLGPAGLVLTACGDGNGNEGDADADEVSPDPQPDTEVPPDTPGDPDVTTDPDAGDPPEDPVEEDAAPDPDVVEDAVEDAVEEDGVEDPVEEEVTECDAPLIYHPGFDICVSTEDQGRNCADGTACEQGQECVVYYGIAGNRIEECYIECGPTPGRLCPEGYSCMDISDGPQNVCRIW